MVTTTYPKVETYPILDKSLFAKAQAYTIKEGLRLMQEHGIGSDWSFKLNKNTSSLGLCNYGKKTIEISIWNVWSNKFSDVRNTILHEIAHVIAGWYGDYGHGKVWKRIAISIGCDGERCNHMKTPNRYLTSCPSCGRKGEQNVKRNRLACRNCCDKWNNGDWHEMFIIEWKKNPLFL